MRYEDPGLVCDVNVKSLIDTVTLAFEKMMPRKRGQIALIASLSGLGGGFITNPVYGATKAAVCSFANAVRVRYRKYNVGVSLVDSIEICSFDFSICLRLIPDILKLICTIHLLISSFFRLFFCILVTVYPY